MSLESQKQNNLSQTTRTDNLLFAAFGIDRPVEPSSGTPTLGMSPEEAMMLVSNMFNRFQEVTGLVHVTRWQTKDAIQFEDQITQALGTKDNTPFILTSDARHSEGAGVIHVMPLLHRNKKGSVVPIEIEIPNDLLGAEKVFTLMSEARQEYMLQLISNGRRRFEVAKQGYDLQNKQVERWKLLSEKEKDRECQQDPTVTITQSYNFELGIIVYLDAPEMISRREYEDVHRPRFLDSARSYMEKFAALCQKLEELNTPGGKADILTFKLLVDSMIRRAPLSISSEFQNDYKDWVSRSSLLVRTAINEWAKDRGLPSETIAADNILFNTVSEVTPEQKSVVIQPWVMVDLHDFAVRIDREQGIMTVFPSGKTPALRDVFIPDPENGITDLDSLHKRFHSWVANNLRLDDRANQENIFTSNIVNDPQIGGMIELSKAKQLLFKGDARHAAETIRTIRRFDLAPIYFWGAVAHQYQFLERNHAQFGLNLTQYGESERVQILLNGAISLLIEFMKTLELSEKSKSEPVSDSQSLFQQVAKPNKIADPYGISQEARTQRALILVDKEAQRFVQQLQSRDESFIEGLLEEQPDILELENKSLNWSEEDETRVSAAIYALSSLELLHLAETMKNTAIILPFEGVWTPELKQAMDQIIEQTRSLTYKDSPIKQQIEDLAKHF